MTYPMTFGTASDRTITIELEADDLDPTEPAFGDQLADIAMRSEGDAVYAADKWGQNRVYLALLARVGRAQQLMAKAADDMDRALGAIHFIASDSE